MARRSGLAVGTTFIPVGPLCKEYEKCHGVLHLGGLTPVLGEVRDLLDFGDEGPDVAVLSCISKFEVELEERSDPEGMALLKSPKVKHMHIDVDDTPQEMIGSYFAVGAEFIDQMMKDNREVYVHCRAGISRSATMTVAFLILKGRIRASAALNHVKQFRPMINPNSGFLEALAQLDLEALGPLPASDPTTRPEWSDRPAGIRLKLAVYGASEEGDKELEQEDVAWCPPPVQVSVDEYLDLGNLGEDTIRNASMDAGSRENAISAALALYAKGLEGADNPSKTPVVTDEIEKVEGGGLDDFTAELAAAEATPVPGGE